MAQIYISLGSNINREHYVEQGLSALATEFGHLSLSSLFESEAIGFAGAPFYNMVIGIVTDKPLAQVVVLLREIEFSNGRTVDAKKFSPRTLDLDLLLYDELVLSTPAQIPRDEITKNAFVLWPLAELAADIEHPIERLTYQQLWQAYNKNSQQLRKVPLNWRPPQD
jgi:2-amino-4-hydroxy-6-hydroxymethyldihydropteridine diphosphokinase